MYYTIFFAVCTILAASACHSTVEHVDRISGVDHMGVSLNTAPSTQGAAFASTGKHKTFTQEMRVLSLGVF